MVQKIKKQSYIISCKGDRAYISNNGSVSRGFISSHSIDNYGWRFTRKTTDNGYVKPRQ